MLDKEGGAIFKPESDTTPAPAKQRRARKSDPDVLQKQFVSDRDPTGLDALATNLSVSTEALQQLGCGWALGPTLEKLGAWGAGWSAEDRSAGAWSFPERDGAGKIVGFGFRLPDGRKGAGAFEACGLRRGLTIPEGLADLPGTVLIVEGPSDTAALISVGIPAIGRPSNSGGVELLASCAALTGRDILVVGERDQKPDGKWPGRDGAIKAAAELGAAWSKQVRWVLPPEGFKDCREWIGSLPKDPQQARPAVLEHLAQAATVTGPSDSIRAPIGSVLARNEWVPVPITELGPAEPPTWVWDGYVALGHTTLFTGLWKSGKSTLIGCLLHDISAGGGLVQEPIGIKSLVITEESGSLWCTRRDEFGLEDSVHIISRPFKRKASAEDWDEFLVYVAGLVHEHGYGLVVFDTLPSMWPVCQENDASEVGAAIQPLNDITEAGAGLMLVHHPRKGGGDEGQASRGSGALPGFVDVIVEMRRYDGSDPNDRKRRITTFSRLEGSSPEAVFELTDGGYVLLGDGAQAMKADRMEAIDRLLPSQEPGITAEEAQASWTTKPAPGMRSIGQDLKEGASSGRWKKFGTGKRGDPFRFWNPSKCDSRNDASLGARNESSPDSGSVEGRE